VSKTSVSSLRDKHVLLEMFVSDKTEAKRVKSSALPWFITSRVSAVERAGLGDVEQACLALEIDGMPCPMDVNSEDWVRSNFAYICSRYYEKYPRAVAATTAKAKTKASKAKRRAAAQLRKRAKLKAPPPPVKRVVKVSGIDVTSTEFLSTYEWRKVRMEALKKYGPVCQCCGATPATGAVMNVDHVKPRKLFPHLALDVSNLQILCHECNHGKGNWDQTDWR
jgi:5-methylcytosine-specific restriction endonuclease McrA